jgi:dynein assembly factor with WDR repeat domains 1
VRQLINQEPYLISKDVIPQIRELLEKMQIRLKEPIKHKFYLYKTLQTHILPLTNVDFDRSGQR